MVSPDFQRAAMNPITATKTNSSVKMDELDPVDPAHRCVPVPSTGTGSGVRVDAAMSAVLRGGEHDSDARHADEDEGELVPVELRHAEQFGFVVVVQRT